LSLSLSSVYTLSGGSPGGIRSWATRQSDAPAVPEPDGRVTANSVEPQNGRPSFHWIKNPFRDFNSSPEVIRLAVLLHIT
jgi:hypothetical protein